MKVFAHIVIRESTPEDFVVGRYALVVDDDPTTVKGFLTYNAALFSAVRILSSYGLDNV